MNTRYSLPPVQPGSLFFAPMEGITDATFRRTILELYPEWDYLACDFLRVPSAGKYPPKHLIRHFGKDLFEVQWIKDKTLYQILTSHRSFTLEMVQQLEWLQIPWLDLNLGCPSNTVCRNQGGSYLLKDLQTLRPLIRLIRENFKGRFSAKIRTGYSDPGSLEECVRLLNDEGVELITVHGRTREQMYKEPASWELIGKAVRTSRVPVIGNGDVWETKDIRRIQEATGCHAVMVARGALKSPWMAQDHRRGREAETPAERFQRIRTFFLHYRANLETENVSMRGLLKQSKSVSRFMLDGMPDGELIRRRLMLSQTVPEFFSIIEKF